MGAAETSLSQMISLRKQLSLDRETQKRVNRKSLRLERGGGIVSPDYSEHANCLWTLSASSRSGKDRAKLDQRLLKAVSDLQLLNKERGATGAF